MDQARGAGDGMMHADPVVALLEDDEDLREELLAGLRRHGFIAWGAGTASEFSAKMALQPCNAAVIDIGLPGVDGLTVAARLRAASDVIIVMLTGRGEPQDRVEGLERGADAYLVKPTCIRELAAVLLGGLRRLWMGAGAAPVPDTRVRWHLDAAARILVAPGDGCRLRLTLSEARFIGALMRQPDQIVTREEAAHAIHLDGAVNDDLHWVDMLVSRLRRKAAQAGMDLPVRAVRGQGYRFFTG